MGNPTLGELLFVRTLEARGLKAPENVDALALAMRKVDACEDFARACAEWWRLRRVADRWAKLYGNIRFAEWSGNAGESSDRLRCVGWKAERAEAVARVAERSLAAAYDAYRAVMGWGS